jgi:ATP-dependent Clp protease ATP-binding subunit ClpC
MTKSFGERLTSQSREVMLLSEAQALELKSPMIGTEHLLLALLMEEGIAQRALMNSAIKYDSVRVMVAASNIASVQVSKRAEMPNFTPKLKSVLEFSFREAMQLGHSYIGTEHLLLGLVRESEGVGAQIIILLGIDLKYVRAQIIELIHE